MYVKQHLSTRKNWFKNKNIYLQTIHLQIIYNKNKIWY